jgi:hypothetical protein
MPMTHDQLMEIRRLADRLLGFKRPYHSTANQDKLRAWDRLRSKLQRSFKESLKDVDWGKPHRYLMPEPWDVVVLDFFAGRRKAPDKWCNQALLLLAEFKLLPSK